MGENWLELNCWLQAPVDLFLVILSGELSLLNKIMMWPQ